jgi:L-asparagine oxygenase
MSRIDLRERSRPSSCEDHHKSHEPANARRSSPIARAAGSNDEEHSRERWSTPPSGVARRSRCRTAAKAFRPTPAAGVEADGWHDPTPAPGFGMQLSAGRSASRFADKERIMTQTQTEPTMHRGYSCTTNTTEFGRDHSARATHLVLSEHDQNAIMRAIEAKENAATDDPSSYNGWAINAHAQLTGPTKDRIRQFRVSGEPYLVIEDVPLPSYTPPTPSFPPHEVTSETNLHKAAQAIIGAGLGFHFKFSGKRSPGLLDDVYAVQGHTKKQLGTNSEFLDWHVEDGFHDARPDYLSLLCIRHDSAVRTLLLDPTGIILDDDVKRQLSLREYVLAVDPTFDPDRSGIPESKIVSVLGAGNDPQFTFDPSYTTALTQAGERALKELEYVAKSSHVSVNLTAGDLLLLDNRRVAHARTAYSPRFDGTDRWLTRALVRESMWGTTTHNATPYEVN